MARRARTPKSTGAGAARAATARSTGGTRAAPTQAARRRAEAEAASQVAAEAVDGAAEAAEIDVEVTAGPAGGGGGGNGNRAFRNGRNAAFSEFSAYPVLTEEVILPTAPSGIAPRGGGDVGQRAFAAVRDILGWRPKLNDPRGFKAALERSFELSVVEGHVAWKYTPRGYAMMADMGEVTGAQASLLNRARAAVDLVKPLVSSLTPLACDTCADEYEPIRDMVVAELDGLVAELAQPAGPRIQIVDDLFRQLLGAAIVDPALNGRQGLLGGVDPIEAGLLYGVRLRQLLRSRSVDVKNVVQRFGHLYTLQERMGLNRDEVNTVDDERIVSNFMTVEDTVFALWLTWWQERGAFGRLRVDGFRPEPFLGTQLVLVSRSLGVAAEAVQELYFALDSVFIGPPERQTIRLDFEKAGSLYLSELLQWAEDIATTIGPRYITDSGKDGVIALADTLRELRDCVSETVGLVQAGPPSPAMATPRVRFALQKLAAQLTELVDLTDKFTRTAAAEANFETRPAPVFEPSSTES
jgi:hypothetical protein